MYDSEAATLSGQLSQALQVEMFLRVSILLPWYIFARVSYPAVMSSLESSKEGPPKIARCMCGSPNSWMTASGGSATGHLPRAVADISTW